MTREDFVREAIHTLLLELQYASDTAQSQPSFQNDAGQAVIPGADNPIASSALPPPGEPKRMLEATGFEQREPLFGLHNRDYPSLWAAQRLSALSHAPVSFRTGLSDLLRDAWMMGERLSGFDKAVPGKPSALFPTNRDKKKAAEGAFLNFAIGSVALSRRSRKLEIGGPLFAWKVLAFELVDGEPFIGLTHIGHSLLARLAGLTVEQPHAPVYATAFIDHIRTHATGDWQGFKVMFETLRNGTTRDELVAAFADSWPTWTETEAATNAAGYIARGREWGIVEPKQSNGRYELTDFGAELLQEYQNDDDE